MSGTKRKKVHEKDKDIDRLNMPGESAAEEVENTGQATVLDEGGGERKSDIAALEEARKEAAEYQDKYLRLLAEFENYKKRVKKERADLLDYGNEAILRDVLPVVDSLERAVEHASTTDEGGAFAEGIRMILEQLKGVLAKHGVEPIETRGRDFDPNYHEAMIRIDDHEGKYRDNEVVEEHERGYLLKGRLLRPSKVSVAKRSS